MTKDFPIKADFRVYKISSPTIEQGLKDFVIEQTSGWDIDSQATAAENLIELCGRLCYFSFGVRQSPKSNAEYIQHLIVQGHESVLEHASWGLILTGVSRAFTHQLVRHRVGFAFSQLSQQYHDESDTTFVAPEILKAYPNAQLAWEKAISSSLEAYKEMISILDDEEIAENADLNIKETRRLIRSAARSVLPNASSTSIAVTANARALRNFFRLRASIEGDPEMREVAVAIFRKIQPEAPSVFFDFYVDKLQDGSNILRCR